MSRRLVQRSRNNEGVLPAPHQRQRQYSENAPRSTVLPPYEPPSCPLSESARRKLEDLRANHDYTKYKIHLKTSTTAIIESTADANERLSTRMEHVKKKADKRREKGIDATEADEEAEKYALGLEGQVKTLTTGAEKALRELIDYADELAMRDNILAEVSANIAAAPVLRPTRGRRQRRIREGSNLEESEQQEEEAPTEDAEILSAVELLQVAKENYAASYAAKTLTERYGDQNDYRNFKRTVHDAQNPGEDAPNVPHVSTWFPEEGTDGAGKSRRRANNNTDNINNADDDDGEVVIQSASRNFKCPLTLQWFREPYSNNICKHTFEKSAILEYHHANAAVFDGKDRRRKTKCVQAGCEAMLALDDFYDDALLLRQIKRAKKQAKQLDNEEDEEDDGHAPRETQANRPEELDDEEEGGEEAVQQDQRHRAILARVKRERHQSRGLSIAPSQIATNGSPEPDDSEIEEIDATQG